MQYSASEKMLKSAAQYPQARRPISIINIAIIGFGLFKLIIFLFRWGI